MREIIMKQMALIVSLFFLVAVGAEAFASKQAVTITARSPFVGAVIGHTANIQLTVTVTKDEGNRKITVSCDGIDGGIYVSSEKSLEELPQESPEDKDKSESRSIDFGFNLPSASYSCRAVLTRMVDGKAKEFATSVNVRVV